MSLPRAFGTRLETIPSAGGYLRADPARICGMASDAAGGSQGRPGLGGQSGAFE